MIPRNCLAYALDRWHLDGGYFECRRSSHWGIAHALHRSVDGEVTSYVPPQALRKPAQSLVGFEGDVALGDDVGRALPMSVLGIVASAWILAIGATAWAVGRVFRGGR